MITHLTAQLVAILYTVWATKWNHNAAKAVEGPTREYEALDLDALGIRQLRQIHGRTAPELAAEVAAADQADSWEWARIEAALSCDADFREIANRLNSQFP